MSSPLDSAPVLDRSAEVYASACVDGALNDPEQLALGLGHLNELIAEHDDVARLVSVFGPAMTVADMNPAEERQPMKMPGVVTTGCDDVGERYGRAIQRATPDEIRAVDEIASHGPDIDVAQALVVVEAAMHRDRRWHRRRPTRHGCPDHRRTGRGVATGAGHDGHSRGWGKNNRKEARMTVGVGVLLFPDPRFKQETRPRSGENPGISAS